MSHQVSISYHGAGIKASEIASSVGLGWTLNAGGVITRSVRGAPDERIYDGQLTGYWLDGVNTTWFNNSAQRDQIKQGRRDIQSDLYFYNFAGYTGSFYFDQAKNVVQRNETDLIIKAVQTTYIHNRWIWKITTPDGSVYHFGDTSHTDGVADDVVSYSQHYAQPKNALGAPTTTSTLVDSWYLVQAQSYDGQSVITFDYEYEAYTFRNLGTSSRTIVDRDGRNLINLNESSFNNLNPVLATESLSPRLTEISTTETSIFFHYGPEKRRDLDHDFNTNYHPKNVVPIPPAQVNDATALDYIEVKSLSPSGCLKRFDFGQSYFTSPAIGFTGTLGLTQYNDVFGDYYADMRRLRLNQISEQSCALTDNKTHRFTYKSNTFQRRLTYAQDHHGYPNNRTDNITLMPQLTIQGSANQVPKIDLNHLATLADRKPNAFYTEQMMLDSIIYPSGGSTVFDYEGHNHYSSDVQETGFTLVDLRNQNCASPQPPPSCTSCCLAQELTSPVVTLDPSSIIRHEMRVTVTKTPNDNSNTLIQVPIEIKRGNANWQLFDEIILNTANEFNQVKCYSELLFEQAGVTDYRFRISADVNRKLFMQLLVKKYERTDIMRNIAVGGLRIKSITDDPVIGPSITRSYDSQL